MEGYKHDKAMGHEGVDRIHLGLDRGRTGCWETYHCGAVREGTGLDVRLVSPCRGCFRSYKMGLG